MANFKRNSRYTGGLISKNRSGEKFLILRRQLNIKRTDGDTFVTITKELLNRPDLISSKAYGTPSLWWVIMEFNGIRDPFFDLKEGQILVIPELQKVLNSIASLER